MRAPVKTILSVLLTAGGLLPAQEPPTFRSDTQVVLLDLVARDRKGKTVADLRADEVQVFEDGTRCEIESFRLVQAPGEDEPAHRRPYRPPETAGSPAETATPSRANLVVLVFDVLPVATAPLARQGALDLLAKEFPANTWFAVFKVDRGGMRLLQAFTSDASRLASAVDFATTGDDARRGRTRGVAADGHDSPRDDHHPGGRAHPTGRPAQPGARRDRRPGRSGTSRRSPTGRRPSTRSTACSPSPGASSLSADGSRSSTSPRPARCPTA